MKHYWEQLQPGERRLFAVIALALFLVFNWIMVWPHFSDWGKANLRIKKANDLMSVYSAEIKNKPLYEEKIRILTSGGVVDVVAEDQAIDFVRFYTSRANSNNVQVINNNRPTVRTNDPFFVDHEMQLSVQGRENQIVNFLYSLGAGNSAVRVRGMSLRPDGAHQQLNANINIVASYAKRAPARAAAPGATPPKPAVTPPAPAPAKTAAQTNKPLVTATHNNASTNKPLPLTVKRP